MRVMIALIHNHDSVRNRAMRRTVSKLIGSASDVVDFQVVEVGWQPEDIVLRKREVLKTAYHNAIFGFLMEFYSKKPGLLAPFLALYRGVLVALIFFSRDTWSSVRGDQSLSRAVQLSRKHNQAWGLFLESGSDWLLVLEDDALLLKGGEARFRELLRSLNMKCQRTFVMLARGYDLFELRAEHLRATKVDDFSFSTSVPFANTTAGYLVDRTLVQAFATYTSKAPQRLLQNLDFLLNRILMNLNSVLPRGAITCIHFDKPIVDNASLSGRYRSSVTSRL